MSLLMHKMGYCIEDPNLMFFKGSNAMLLRIFNGYLGIIFDIDELFCNIIIFR